MSPYILSEIWVYPIKSLAGVRVTSAVVQEKGLEGDRRMMLVDDSHQFITQRNVPKMTMFSVVINQGLITVSHKNNPELHPITIDPTAYLTTDSFKAVIWDDTVDVQEISPMYSKWFSDALEINCKLVMFPEKNERRVDVSHVPEEKHVSLADGYPYLIMGQASLHDVSKRIGEDLSLKRFRPNFFFEGGAPYEEDTWKDFFIGPVKFHGVKPCARCVLTTIDPDTGLKGVEPLKTLASYRTKNSKVYFGQNVIALAEGTVTEGDTITLI